MILVFLTLAIILVFYSDVLSLDKEKFPTKYRIAFAVLLLIYAGIRFGRLIKQEDSQ